MNAMFGNLTTDGLEEAQDRIGGFSPLETDIYTGKIKLAYAGASDGGAKNVTVVVELAGGREYRETIYVTNKQGQNFFLNKDDPTKKVPLPGFTTIDDICLLSTGSPLCEQPTEEKVIKVYDYDAKAEIPKTVPMMMDLLGKDISLAIVNQLENKKTKDASGKYAATAESRTINFIDKAFHTETRKTVVEARNGADEAVFWDSWIERNKGKTRDKREIKDGGTSGRPNGAAPSAGEQAPRKKLFG